jgi:hypothetical protein
VCGVTDDGSIPGNERERILVAAHDELLRWGIDRFSIPALAHRHGLDQNEIRSLWGDTPEQLILDVLARWPGEDLAAPDSGDLRTDLYWLAMAMASYVTSEDGRTLQSAHLIGDRELPSVEIRRQAWRTRADRVRVVFDRAHQRGELRDGVDALTALELLFAPINMRVLFTGELVDDDYCRLVAELVWRAVGTGK